MLKETIFNRRTVRKYTNEVMEKELLEELLMYASMGPSNGNSHPVEFLIVEEKENKKKLADVERFGTAYIADAPTVIVIIANKEVCKTWVEEGAIAASYLQLLLEEEGYSSSWINIHGNKTPDKEDTEDYVRREFNIPEKYGVLCLIPFGKKNERVRKRKEFEIGEKAHYEKF
ncbi:MAG: nitroreductase family protein [Tissierellia bacterium]|nr:nitroreductase family protein [Tissierellia bacterium]